MSFAAAAEYDTPSRGASAAVAALPTHKLFLGLMGLCRQGQQLQAEEHPDDPGMVFYSWAGLAAGDGDLYGVWVAASDREVIAAIERGGHRNSLPELAAVLTRACELHGQEGAWALERPAELLHGPRDPRRSRQRQVAPLRGWVALLERGSFVLHAPAKGAGGKSRDNAKRAAVADVYAGHLEGPIITIERDGRQQTLQLHGELAKRIGPNFRAAVPESAFRLAQKGHHNPQGNRPSRADKARLRLGAVWCERLRRRTGQPVKFQELLLRWAGVDEGRVERRRAWPLYLDMAIEQLEATAAAGGAGLAEQLDRRGPARYCKLHLAHPSKKHARRRQPPQRPAPARASDLAAKPSPPRGRPVAHGPP